ncbi:MAG: D-lyxose/D-mannose family sugar isomerase [Ruminococcaceae bacterium]|nr:D-lyxose/D-mannose family sugar isomerase [Oscillospiraceae bacterium]
MTRNEYNAQVEKALELFDKAGIILTEGEKENMEVADFGQGKVNELGLQLVVYVNTERVCAKEMVLLPFQTCPEHMHIPTNGKPGKEETFRCRYGEVYLYVSGEKNTDSIKAKMPPCDVSVFHEIVLKPGEQYTLEPETWHWFQAGPNGAVISEFSTRSTDETDIFTDKKLVRQTVVEG